MPTPANVWLLAVGPELWATLRDVIRLVPDHERRDPLYGKAARLLGRVASFAPFAHRQSDSDLVRQNVNEESMFRLQEAAGGRSRR